MSAKEILIAAKSDESPAQQSDNDDLQPANDNLQPAAISTSDHSADPSSGQHPAESSTTLAVADPKTKSPPASVDAFEHLKKLDWSVLREELYRHRVPVIVIAALLICPKLILPWVALVLIWSGLDTIYPKLPVSMRIGLSRMLPQKWKESIAFRELSAGIDQVRPFIFLSLYIFCIPIALVWMYAHWIMRLAGKSPNTEPARQLCTDDKITFLQNQRNSEEEEDANFFHSPAFSLTTMMVFVGGIPAALTYFLYSTWGIDAILGFPSAHPAFRTVFILVHLYLFSVGSCLSVLFLRSWFTFPLNFLGDEAQVELTKTGVRKRIKSWLSPILTFNAPGAGGDSLDWKEIKSLNYDGTFATSLYPLPRETFPFNNTVYKIANSVAAVVEGINKRLRSTDREQLYFRTAKSPTEIGSQLSIELSDMDAEQRAKFYYAVRNWAPHVEIDEQCHQKMLGSNVLQAPRYTQLWFQLLTDEMHHPRIGTLSEGDVLKTGNLTIKQRLASGGQANVYLAVNADEQEVVVKEFILSNADAIGSMVESAGEFEVESTLLSQLDHPRIVRMINYFAEDRRLYIAMEKVEGESLRQLVKSRKDNPYTEIEVARIALQICEVLEYLHAQLPPIIHRDLTPDNILFNDETGAKVIDFSLAAGNKTRRTTSTMGKHCYAPPEQLREQPCPQSDIYSLGATMYYLLVGEDPKPITTSDPKSKRANLSDKIQEIVQRATAFEVTDRYTGTEWLKLDLQTFLADQTEPGENMPKGNLQE